MRRRNRTHRTMMTAIVASSMLMLSACSLVEQANQSLSYVSGATDYINQVSSAGTELQQLATDAINNPDVTGQLQEKIDLIQAEAAEFSEMSAPAIGENIHENLVSYNIQLTEVMNQFETSIAEQGITAENWEKTGIPELINNINSLKEPLSGLQTE
ncbi:DUF6376 family protein [Paenibacillus sp. 2TAF8]|uniref:DUF6376 family protein n=1 Tax=Paenibacillus sp. 2TAF8 TaxID=3233020 RepID=UPI003F982189